MIALTRLNGSEIVVNAEMIENIESMPDTVISLLSGKKIIVKESPGEIMDKVKAYKSQVYSQGPRAGKLEIK